MKSKIFQGSKATISVDGKVIATFNDVEVKIQKPAAFKPGSRVYFKGYNHVKPFVGILTFNMTVQRYFQDATGNCYSQHMPTLTFDENGKFVGFPNLPGLEHVNKRKFESLMRKIGEN